MEKKTPKEKKKSPLSYQERTYRKTMAPLGLTQTSLSIRETDLFIFAEKDVKDIATKLVLQFRSQLENYIDNHPDFQTALTPLDMNILAPPIVKDMLAAGQQAGVGPMAAVAGAMAEYVGQELLHSVMTNEITVENGGDVFMHRKQESIASIYAGTSPLSYRIGIKIPKDFMPCGICTSSGTIGHSLSLGQADSVTVVAVSTALADAAATRIGNEVKNKSDMEHALETARNIGDIRGVVIVQNEQLGVWGDIELIPLASSPPH